MTQLTRRRALRGLGTSGIVVLAGCQGRSGFNGNGDDGGNGDDNGDDGHGSDGSDDDGDENVTADIRQVGTALSGPAWDYRERVGICVLLREEGDGGWLFADADEGTRQFVADTDFGTSVLLYVESVGPTTCYNALEVDAFRVADGTLLADAAAVDTAADAEICGEALTYPGTLVRATTDDPVEQAKVTVTNGWGDRETVRSDEGVRDPASLDGYVRPAGDPKSIPGALDCDEDGFERHPAGYADPDAVSWGTATGIDGGDGLELRVVNPGYEGDDDTNGDGDDVEEERDDDGEDDPPERADEALTFSRGDEVRVELTNVSSTAIGIGNHGKYNLETLTEEGWTDVRGVDGGDPFAYTDELLVHPPGETVEWSFTMTEEGLVEGGPHADRLRVCPELRPGRYRFVFWGAGDVAVAFDYEG